MNRYRRIKGKENRSEKYNYDEKKLISLRLRVNELYFNHHLSKNHIAQKQGVSKRFVIKWTKKPDLDFNADRRGWPRGKRRKWSKDIEEKIVRIYHDLENDPREFYTGATVIADAWRKRYPRLSPPPLITIGRILSDLGLSRKRRKDKHKGASKYLCYPEHTIYHLLGGRVLEADFVGEKYLQGRSQPLNFIAFSFKQEPKLRYFKRIAGQTADDFIGQSEHFFRLFEKPDFVKVDNCLATIGSGSGKRNISRVMAFLLKEQVIPIFAVPRKPFSQASVEGNNSVFARKFWHRVNFKSLVDVDKKLAWFNAASQRYLHYQPPATQTTKKDFIPRVYFIRQVKEDQERSGRAYIDVLNEEIRLSKSLINYFVLAEWNLKREELAIWLEKDKQPSLIKRLPFKINPRSQKLLK